MSVLGKVLIFFNLLAAGAFAYFTLQDWKVRQELTSAAVSRELPLTGLAVDPQSPAPTAEELGQDRAAFQVDLPSGKLTSIRKDLFEKIIPKGGDLLGGGPVATQTEEVTRLQKKVQEVLAAEKKNPQTYFAWIQAYLIGVVRTGADRDGINALFDLANPKLAGSAREESARHDLAYLGNTPSRVLALQTLVAVASLRGVDSDDLNAATRDSRILLARKAVERFLTSEVPHGAGGADKKEAERKLSDAVLDALKKGAGDAEKQKVAEAVTATDKDEKARWTHLANVAVEPLADKASRERAMAELLAYTQEGATESEKKAYAGVKDLIYRPDVNFDLAASVEATALDLLNAKFEDAARPSGTKATAENPAGEKARKIAHLLYHIDGWRHRDTTPTAIADRKAWHERVATVVGLPNYVKAAEAQASEYSEASQRLISAITEEQSAFEAEYQTQLQQVLFLFNQWLTLENQYRAQESVTGENKRLKEERETERNNLAEALKDAIEGAKNALVKLQKTQTALFTVQKDLRDALAALLTLEKELRRLEVGTK
jgi:hypothetical protein